MKKHPLPPYSRFNSTRNFSMRRAFSSSVFAAFNSSMVLVMIYEVDRAENNMIVYMPLVNVRREYILMLPLCYRVGKLPPDFMGFLIVHFPRRKGLYQVKG